MLPNPTSVATIEQQTISYEKRRDQERDEEAEVRRMEREARKERYLCTPTTILLLCIPLPSDPPSQRYPARYEVLTRTIPFGCSRISIPSVSVGMHPVSIPIGCARRPSLDLKELFTGGSWPTHPAVAQQVFGAQEEGGRQPCRARGLRRRGKRKRKPQKWLLLRYRSVYLICSR